MTTTESIYDLPLKMVIDLKKAINSEKAEQVFHFWRDKGIIVPAHARASIWMLAEGLKFWEEGNHA